VHREYALAYLFYTQPTPYPCSGSEGQRSTDKHVQLAVHRSTPLLGHGLLL